MENTDNGVSTYTVVPKNLALDKDYEFYIWVKANGNPDWFISDKFTLIVGCTSRASLSYLSSFRTSLTLKQGDRGDDVYTIVPPSLSLDYCPVQKYSISNLIVDD